MSKQTGGIAESLAAENGRSGTEKAAIEKAVADDQQHKTFH